MLLAIFFTSLSIDSLYFLCDSASKVTDVFVVDDTFFILDGVCSRIWKYSKEGEIAGFIGEKGEAPEEIMAPYSMDIFKSRIVVGSMSKISIFTTLGKFMECKQNGLGLLPWDVLWMDTSIVTLWMGPEKNVIILSDRLKILNKFQVLFTSGKFERINSLKHLYPRAFSPRRLGVFKGNIIFYDHFTNSIVQFSMKGKLIGRTKIKIKGWFPPPIEREKNALFVEYPCCGICGKNDEILCILKEEWKKEWKVENNDTLTYVLVVLNGNTQRIYQMPFKYPEGEFRIHRLAIINEELHILCSLETKRGIYIKDYKLIID